MSRAGMLLFALPFLLGGLFAGYQMGFKPLVAWLDSRDWVEEPARIDLLELASDNDSDGDRTYWIRAKFRYHHDGRLWKSERFEFVESKTNVGIGGMKERIQTLRADPAPICWVNPQNPREAVLDRSMTLQSLIGLAFPVPFLVVGLGLGGWALFGESLQRRFRQKQRDLIVRLHLAGLLHTAGSGPETGWVFSRHQSLRQLFLSAGVAAFWNGIVAVFLIVLIIESISGDFPLFLAVFLIPFEIIGAFLIYAVAVSWFSWRRLNLVAAVSPWPDPQGGTTKLSLAAVNPVGTLPKPPCQLQLVACANALDSESGSPCSRWSGFGLKKRRAKTRSGPENTSHELLVIDLPQPTGCFEIELPAMPQHRGKPHIKWSREWLLRVGDSSGRSADFSFLPLR